MTSTDRRALRALLWTVDGGFVVYWLISGLHLLPPEWLYANADDPAMVAWNWSFLPLDLVVSATGFGALLAEGRSESAWRTLTTASLAFTSASGMGAIAFWALRGDFDPAWWAPNLALMVAPWWFLGRLACPTASGPAAPEGAER